MATIALVFNMGHPAPPPPPPAAPPPPPAAPPPPPPPQNVVIDLRGVNFKFDRPKKGESDIGPTLKPPASDSVAILDQAVDTLNRYPQVKIEIDGYTDSVGTDQYNQGLSERRANIVNQYLTSHGIDSSRITSVKGFGETNPIDTNETAAGRQRNRRVEFKVEQPQNGSM
jgi:OOP family OmpA-OmpF porin